MTTSNCEVAEGKEEMAAQYAESARMFNAAPAKVVAPIARDSADNACSDEAAMLDYAVVPLGNEATRSNTEIAAAKIEITEHDRTSIEFNATGAGDEEEIVELIFATAPLFVAPIGRLDETTGVCLEMASTAVAPVPPNEEVDGRKGTAARRECPMTARSSPAALPINAASENKPRRSP